MRRVSIPQSAIAYPLNRILSTEGNVRLLRILAGSSGGLSITDLARKAGLTDRGARIAVAKLELTGIIELLGAGSARQAKFRLEHPLAVSLAALFRAEEGYFETITDGLRTAIEGLSPAPSAAWIQSPVALGRDRPGDPIIVVILAGAATVDEAATQLERAIEDLEKSMDVTIEIRGVTRADLAVMTETERRHVTESMALVGPAPSVFAQTPKSLKSTHGVRARRHTDLDARGLAFGSAIAAAIKRDPALIDRARAWIDKRAKRASAGERRELEEWQRLLRTTSPARLRRLLIDHGERATRLRQTLPFLQALTAAERDALMDAAESNLEHETFDA